MQERTWRVHELADYLRVNERTVRRWIAAGMPALNIGTRERPEWRVEEAAWRAWLAARHRGDDGEPDPSCGGPAA
jgi:excisionase family DNA binding protein